MSGARAGAPNAIRRAAEAVGAAAFIDGLPTGYDTLVRRGGGLFSGGQRQRLGLARAFLRDGPIWLLDEPVTGLDHESAAAMTERLLEATRGRTALWVSHDPGLLPRMDWVLELEAGRVAFSGPPAEHAGWKAHAGSAGPLT